MSKKNYLWVREDFRIDDNPALYNICNIQEKIEAFFIYDEKKFKNRSAQRWWLHKTLVNFQNKLNNIGISFKVYADNEILYIKKLIKNEKIENFYYNAIARPDERLIENEIERNLAIYDVNYEKFESNLLQILLALEKKIIHHFKFLLPIGEMLKSSI